MARNRSPRAKQARRLGVKLFEGISKSYDRRPYPPGIHGSNKRPGKMSIYGQQLREKQIAKKLYGLLEKQFANYYKMATNKKGDSAGNFIKLLESRLDNVVYRLGMADTRQQARQLVNHGHICVNGKKVDIPSYQLNVGDTITVKENKVKSRYWSEIGPRLEKVSTPIWLNLDAKELSGKVLAVAGKDDTPVPFDIKMIIEFYSK
jgi:small subunit ribosomal protein S4